CRRASARQLVRGRRTFPVLPAAGATVRRRDPARLGGSFPAAARERHADLLLLQARRRADRAALCAAPPGVSRLASPVAVDYLKLLAELTVHVGANLRPGQDVMIMAWDSAQAPVARAIAEVNWTVVPGPSPGWAERLFGEADEERLWQTLAPILRLDAQDPVQAWRDHVARLGERAAALNERGFSAVRFEGPATDLTVGLIDGHRWLAATFPTTWGPVAVVNMPTEEVFTTPDRNRVEGTVRMTKPVLMTGG